VVADGLLLAGIEFKSQVGPSGTITTTERKKRSGAPRTFGSISRGRIQAVSSSVAGYMMLLEEAPGSMRPVRAQEPHFKVFPEFKAASYAKRYEYY